MYHLLFVLFTFIFTFVNGCSDFQLKTKSGSIMCGRTMDFMIPMKSQILVFNRGTNMSSFNPDGSPGLQWISDFGFVAINAFNIDLADEGMNEVGLTCGFLTLNGGSYPPMNPNKKNVSLAVMDFCMWVLSSFSTTQQVMDNINNVQIWGNTLPVLNIVMGLHVPIHDALGNNLVVEFMNNKVQVYNNPLGVLTNEPPLSYQLQNLAQYMYLSPNMTQQTTVNGFTLLNEPNSGLHGLPGGWSSTDRFVRLATLIRYVMVDNMNLPNDDALLTATHILNSVYATNGMELGYFAPMHKYVSVTTRWSTIKDLINKVFYFRNSDGVIRAIYLNKLNFDASTNHYPFSVHRDKILVIDETKYLSS